MHNAKVICDSISPAGARLTTMIVVMPRIVLAEFNTHRVFSRNSASSRAIPVERMIAAVEKNPYVPTTWGRNQAGMQESKEQCDKSACLVVWLQSCREAIWRARQLSRLGVHKQTVNRLLEPFMWHTVLVSSTEWSGFFAQRCHPDAHPDIRIVAKKMRDALTASEPVERTWHVPFTDRCGSCEDKGGWWENGMAHTTHWVNCRRCKDSRKIAIARCARVSYLTHDGKHDTDADLRLYDRLRNADPPHASPFEHVAWAGEGKRNFRGWIQERERLGI